MTLLAEGCVTYCYAFLCLNYSIKSNWEEKNITLVVLKNFFSKNKHLAEMTATFMSNMTFTPNSFSMTLMIKADLMKLEQFLKRQRMEAYDGLEPFVI